MKKIPLLTCILLVCGSVARSQNTYFINGAGSYINADSGIITLNNTSFANDGSANINGKVIFTGTQPTTLGGAGSTVIKNITVGKTGSALLMTGDVNASGTLHFMDGLLDLNLHTMSLGTTGQLSGESETAHATGIAGGSIEATTNNVEGLTENNIGNLGASLTSSGSLGTVNIARYHKPFENAGNSSLTGIQRSYLIQSTNNSSSTTLRFYYLDAELNGKDENSLSLWQSNDGVAWTDIGVDGRNTTANFVEKNNINNLSWFTLTDASNVLPVRLISFKATCQNGYALLQWQTGSEVNAASFTIEKSSNGTTWNSLQTVAATNALNGSNYSYKDASPEASAYYQIRMTDNSGNNSYSPVFSGGCSEITRPLLVYPNPAHSNVTVSFAVRQSGTAVVQLYSFNGQLLFSRKEAVNIGTNNIVFPVASLAAGTYSVKLFINGQTLESKLVKD